MQSPGLYGFGLVYLVLMVASTDQEFERRFARLKPLVAFPPVHLWLK